MNVRQHTNDALNADALHSACLIDENGKEVPITRDMIRHSCQQLEQAENHPPHNLHSSPQ